MTAAAQPGVAGPFRVTIDSDSGWIRYRVEDTGGDLDPFFAWRERDMLLVSYDPLATTDLKQVLDPRDWEHEFGGYCSYQELLHAVETAGKP